ncbi:MAG: hypothetical protein NW200_15045 [Hyphomonadaceae bacterium]|nr:hypothetical protein [Hyphomonadaceae bacterium]
MANPFVVAVINAFKGKLPKPGPADADAPASPKEPPAGNDAPKDRR